MNAEQIKQLTRLCPSIENMKLGSQDIESNLKR